MIAKKSVLVVLNTFVGAALGLVAIKLLAFYLGRQLIGEVEYAFGFLGILFFLTDLGVASAHVKRVSEGMDEADCFATFAVFKLVSTAAFLAIAGGFLYVYVSVLGKTIEDTTPLVIVLVMTYLVTNSLRQIYISTFDARRETARGQLILLVDTVVRVAASIGLALAFAALVRDSGPFKGELSAASSPLFAFIADRPAAALAATYVLGGVVALGATLLYARRALHHGKFRGEILRSYWRFALPLFLVSAIGAVSAYIDRAALGYFGGASDAGAFGPLRRATQVIESIPTAVTLLLFPTISALDARGDRAAVVETVDRGLRYTSLAMVPAVTLMAVFAPAVIHIALSDEWLPVWPTLSVLAIYSFILGLQRPYVSLVSGMNRTDIVARAGLVMAISNILLNLVLIPDDIKSLGIPLFGLRSLGAAIATALSGLLGLVLLMRASRRLVGYVGSRSIVLHVVAGLGMAGVLLAVDLFLIQGIARWYHLVLLSALGGVVYFALLVVLGEFTRKDWDLVLSAVNPREMASYVRGELLARKRG